MYQGCIDSLQLSLNVFEEEVSPEQQHCEQEWSPSLGQEDPEPTQIKEEPEEFRTDNQKNAYSHNPAMSSHPVGLDSRPPLNPNPTSDLNRSMGKHGSKPSIMSRKTHRCGDCGETFPLKADHQRHVTRAKKRLSECCYCKNRCNSNCKLKAHVQLCHGGKPCTCPVCGKTIKNKGDLSRHKRIHKGDSRGSLPPVHIDGATVEKVKRFKFIGVPITDNQMVHPNRQAEEM
ncbi:zinc finger protein 658B-like [Oncorhynchus tshawytscha]|uniref:zinc finger protein 658B-like n=1 Tax=Oncorhynchus tshawytscha TaxID=74940 RepID=UPI000D09A5E9|nr:zinc finger protein 658B-like [Oncorhynchus tshawytscha]